MSTWVCATCGNHFPDPRPDVCVVCADERQWLPPDGQRWTTLAELAAAGHRSDVRAVEPGLTGIGADPPVAIGQRSLLVRTAAGNVLWDPSGFIDDAAVAAVREAGGLGFVTASHPHFYGAIAEWARVFGAEILVPADDAAWLRAGPDAAGADLVGDLRRAARGDARPVRRALPRQRRAALGRRRGRPRRPAERGHDLRDAGRGPGDVRLVGAEPAAAVRGGRARRLGGGAAVSRSTGSTAGGGPRCCVRARGRPCGGRRCGTWSTCGARLRLPRSGLVRTPGAGSRRRWRVPAQFVYPGRHALTGRCLDPPEFEFRLAWLGPGISPPFPVDHPVLQDRADGVQPASPHEPGGPAVLPGLNLYRLAVHPVHVLPPAFSAHAQC